ncbi:MAG: hypothetical protein RLZZ342_415 [Candidatus Parcubacteria bacterium]|jgi:hypothetical protein
MRSIQESWLKIKHLERVGAARAGEAMELWAIPILVVLVGVASFGLGQLSALEAARPIVDIRESSRVGEPRALALGGQFVALRTGSVYYFPWCSGAQQIPPEKQVWFVSENAAKKAGYRPAKNCRGLQSP